MERYEDYDPQKHKGKPVYELRTEKRKGESVTLLVEADPDKVPPWHLVARVAEKQG